MPEIKMTWKQAEMIGIVFCECGHRTNNHFQHGKKPCAHCKCQKLQRGIYLPKTPKKKANG